eukprot:2011636-Rhodomonas_salina.2
MRREGFGPGAGTFGPFITAFTLVAIRIWCFCVASAALATINELSEAPTSTPDCGRKQDQPKTDLLQAVRVRLCT